MGTTSSRIIYKTSSRVQAIGGFEDERCYICGREGSEEEVTQCALKGVEAQLGFGTIMPLEYSKDFFNPIPLNQPVIVVLDEVDFNKHERTYSGLCFKMNENPGIKFLPSFSAYGEMKKGISTMTYFPSKLNRKWQIKSFKSFLVSSKKYIERDSEIVKSEVSIDKLAEGLHFDVPRDILIYAQDILNWEINLEI